MIAQIDIKQKSDELKSYISQFETVSFVSQFTFALNVHSRTSNKMLNVKSPLRQISYLIALFLSTAEKGSKVYDPVTGDVRKIERLLEEIELGYRYNDFDLMAANSKDQNALKDYLLVSNQTYVNYFMNGDLNYVEQEIERIQRTFTPFENLIKSKTGLEINDFLRFYDLIEEIDFIKLSVYIEKIKQPDIENILLKKVKNDRISSEEFEKIFNTVENSILSWPFDVNTLAIVMPLEKVKKLIEIFSVKRKSNDEYLYYTDDCMLLRKPIVQLAGGMYITPCAKQLIHAIYDYLFEQCQNASDRNIIERRDKVLEEKVYQLMQDFFGNKARVFRNYFIGTEEKDILVLYRNLALIIECKASRYREPMRDPTKAFVRIKDDFKKNIQKGFDQASQVYNMFNNEDEIEIKDSKGRIIDSVKTRKFDYVFSVIVTGERFGQIQCDLDLLLERKQDEDFPWSVYIDDLEIFLLTLQRKENFYGELLCYLQNRMKLHGRLICFDELELCSYYLLEKVKFIKTCNGPELFYSSPDLHLLFDDLYQTGMGFKNERNLDKKANLLNGRRKRLIQQLKLRTPHGIQALQKTYKYSKK